MPSRPAVTRKRESKYASLKKDQKGEEERKRTLWLKSVRNRTEERRWELRADAGLRREWVEERKGWEESRKREAEGLGMENEEDLEGGEGYDGMGLEGM
jgi:transposase